MITRAVLNQQMQLIDYLEPLNDHDNVDAELLGSVLPHERGLHLLMIAGECDLHADRSAPTYCWDVGSSTFIPIQHTRPDFIVAMYRLIEALDELPGFELPEEARAWYDWTRQRGVENVRRRAAVSAGEVTGQ